MIRLPHSSVSLSEQDLSFHLQQIDIYHGLLKQGFNKKEIVRYFKEYRETQGQEGTPEPVVEPTPTCVELAIRSPPPTGCTRPRQSQQGELSKVRIEKEDGALNVGHHSGTNETEARRASAPEAPSNQPTHRHAPRQSSLLRFAKALSSESSSHLDETEDANKYRGPVRTYRPRTETYAYNQSEASETDLVRDFSGLYISPPIQDNDESTTVRNQGSSSPLRPDAESFIPGHLIPSTSAESAHSSEPAARQDQGVQFESPVATHAPTITPRRSSLGVMTMQEGAHHNYSSSWIDFPSSPPVSMSHALQRWDLSPSLPPIPTTPTPARRNRRDAHTAPRSHGPQYLDGSFAVYNDALHARTQPQTPADLVRHQIVTEHEAAYTAPVGMIHTSSASRTYRTINSHHLEPGEQSPTARAMGMRERRARELMRGVRVEGMRLERLRRQDRERMARGIDGNEGGAGERDGPGPAVLTEQWRDELESDRVGDENWEGEFEALTTGRQGMRVTSGNANAGRGWWEERAV